MKLDQLIIKTVLVLVLLMLAKVIFFKFLNLELWPILILFYLVIAAIPIAVVRRLGALNYFEVFLLVIIWLILDILIDLLVTQVIIANGVFSNGHFWLAYLILPIVVLLFHKKIHVEAKKAAKS